MPDMVFDFSAFPEEENPAPLKVMPFDFSVFPEDQNPASTKEMPFDFSAFPEQPKAETVPYAGEDQGSQLSSYNPDSWMNDKIPAAPAFVPPPAPPELWRENASRLQQDIWNMSGPQPNEGPRLDHPLRPDLSYAATGIMRNLEAGLRKGFNYTVANLLSLPPAMLPESERQAIDSTGFGQVFPTREAMFKSTLAAMNKTLQVDNLAPPQDFADSLARGVGESGAPLTETLALSYLTAGIMNPLTEGIATKVPYLYAWLLPIARDAVTFGSQSALDPGATLKSTAMGAGAGAALSLLGPYGRLTRAIGGAVLGVGQEYETNPQAQPVDYARNAALMGTFAAIGGAHGITPEEAAAFTIMDWARAKGYSPEVLEQTIKAQGIGPIANEFADDVTAPQMENGSGVIEGSGPGEPEATAPSTLEYRNGQEVEEAEPGPIESTLRLYRLLAKNLEAAAESRPFGHAAHHIVAFFAEKAQVARDILQKFDIPLSSADNGVWLPNMDGVGEGAYHPELHTDEYHRQVERRLKTAADREEVLEVLRKIKKELSENKFPY